MSSKGKASPYYVWLVHADYKISLHHHYSKMSEAVRVAKKRRPRDGWSIVQNRKSEIVWSTKGFDQIKVKLSDALLIMERNMS